MIDAHPKDISASADRIVSDTLKSFGIRLLEGVACAAALTVYGIFVHGWL